MTDDIADLQRRLDGLLTVFEDARAALTGELGKVFQDSKSAFEALFSHADELGPSHAAETLCVSPSAFGAVRSGHERDLADSADELSSRLEALLDTHDQVDRLSQQREALVGRAQGPGQRLHIQGNLFSLDIDARGLLHANLVHDRDERPLAERLASQLNTTRAEPIPEHQRERGPERSR